MFEVVEIHGEHESGEGMCLWGFAIFNYAKGRMIDGPIYRTFDEARTVQQAMKR